MRWHELNPQARWFLTGVYTTGAILSPYCLLASSNSFTGNWLIVTAAAIFVAPINIRLPQVSRIISMGDVLTILALMEFGPGPALLTYWCQLIVGGGAELYRREGLAFVARFLSFRFLFNIAQSPLSIAAMYATKHAIGAIPLSESAIQLLSLLGIALAWLLVNTGTLSVALALHDNKPLFAIWRQGIELATLNFLGSASAAGLLAIAYEGRALLLFLALPLAAVLYQLYRFHIDKFESAQQHIKQLNALYLQTVEALATAVDAKDRYTHGHTRRVQAYGVRLAELMGITDDDELMAMRSGAILHDIGKIAIPEYILNKPTVLTASEFEKMKIHPSVGAEMLRGINFPFPVTPLVRSHHERWDGRGYPDGLSGVDIPLSARILSLVDCFDALTTDRPYRSPMSRDELVEFFQREAGRAYDPDVVAVFLDNMDEMERAGAEVEPIDRDIWGIEQLKSKPTAGGHRFEHVEPAKAYGEAMNADSHIQRVLYSIFAFARSSRLLNRLDIIEFLALKLEHLIKFDAAVLYLVEGNRSVVVGRHRFGSMAETIPADIEIPLEQKLSGWVAANNQALCNLPPFPDFLRLLEPKPDFELSAIAPVNFRGSVIGSLALYRAGKDRFSDESFRLLEIVASQLAMALSCARHDECETPLFDEDTMLPTSHQIYLMYEQVAVDAQRYDFPLSLIVFHVENLDSVPLSTDGRRNTILRQIVAELQIDAGEGDVFVRHSSDVFVGLYARTDCRQASRLQDRAESRFTELRVQIDPRDDWRLRVAIGAAQFPADGASVEDLFRIAEERAAAKMLDTLEGSPEPSLFHRL